MSDHSGPGSGRGVRVVVVGGGVMGSAAAWSLARRGAEVILLEQFTPGHKNGASHGSSRIFRQAYLEQSYIQLAARALTLWQEIQSRSRQAILTLTSAVDHGPEAIVQHKAAALAQAGVGHRVISPSEAATNWPGLRFDTAVLVHDAAGRLHADRSVNALQSEAARSGADIRHRTKVSAITVEGGGVRISTGRGTIAADAVVVAPGAWAHDLLSPLVGLPALRTTQEQPAHFLPRDANLSWPSFVHHPGAELDSAGIYGLGSDDGIKIGEHATGPEVHPDSRSFLADPAGVARLVDYARRWLPGVDLASVDPISCLYTCTPDHHFLIDRAGPITFAAGFSGHGFKFGPAIGELLAGLTLDGAPPPPEFQLDRPALHQLVPSR